MYFIYGDEPLYIEKKINDIILKNNINNSINFYDDSSFSDIIDSIVNTSLFNDKELIILNDINFNKSQQEQITSFLKKEVNNIVLFVLNCKEKDLDKTNILNSFLLKNAHSFSFNKVDEKDLPNKIIELVEEKGGKINKLSAIYLASKLPNEMLIISSEIEKLLVNDSEINEESIDSLVTKYQTKNVFGFLNALNNKDSLQVFKEYQEKINHGEEVISLISSISTILIICSEIDVLKKQKKSLQEIAEIMGIHSFRIENGNKLLIKMGIKKINELILSLAELDIDIKTGVIEEKIGFEKILLDFIR
ncbi:MAG: DNA polymerase III subunit delta [Metamycoplasmataceae bacterium]